MRAFPLFLQTTDKVIIVFGGGVDAAAKLRLVTKTDADILVVAEHLAPGEIDLAGAQWVQANPLDFTFPGNVAFAYIATGDETFDAEIAAYARANSVLVCAADQPDVSDFITPAIVDRDPVVVAIGSEGTAPVLARMIKAEIEALLPAALGSLSKAAESLRKKVAAALEPGRLRRSFWRRAFKGALTSQLDEQTFKSRADELLNASDIDLCGQGFVSFVGAGPGGADLMTLRARRLLDEADVVLYDALVAPEILELARREALMVNVGKRSGKHSFGQQDICGLIVQHASKGHHVVRLKGGDASIFGRLAEELDSVAEAGVGFEVVPGVTSAAAASASAVAPLTERGNAQELRVITAHGAEGDTDLDWASLANSNSAVAVYMGKRAATDVQRQMIFHGRDPATPVVLVENAGRPQEQIRHAVLGDLGRTAGLMSKGAPLMMLIGVKSRQINAQSSTSVERKAA